MAKKKPEKKFALDRNGILDLLRVSARPMTKRDVARALKVRGDERIMLKEILSALEDDGAIIKSGGAYSIPDRLPAVGVLEVSDISVDGDTFGRPVDWNEEIHGPPPKIEIAPQRRGHPALTVGDRILARLSRRADDSYEAQTMRHLTASKDQVVGLVSTKGKTPVLLPAEKRAKDHFDIATGSLNGAKDGDVVMATLMPSRGLRNKRVRVDEVIGHRDDPNVISLIAIVENGISLTFPPGVLKAAENLSVPALGKREDLRDIPLVTIDGADARDFDDAVFAEKTGDGFHLIVSIADVSHYVRPGSPLDKEAWKRGNSTYFPDRVVPMLPEALSNGLCSLVPHEERACMAVHMWIDEQGELTRYKFVRGLMRSAARLTYEQVQAARNGQTDETTEPLVEPVIAPLYEAYEVLAKAREKRGALDLDLPERQVIIDDKGRMTGIKPRVRLDSHKLIEEFMILANVAAASALEKKKSPCVYRVHDSPSQEKLASAGEFLQSFNLSLPKGQVIKPRALNQILHKAASHPFSHLVSEVILRSQAQAVYSPENLGHFGLALSRYAHFTSPIRRYADLLVHRLLISSHGLGEGGMDAEALARLEESCNHISTTERMSMEAERDAIDRFTAAFLSDRIGGEFSGRIRGVTRFGLFVELAETGADGFVPMRSLPRDQYVHREDLHALVGRYEGRVYRMGAPVTVRLMEADGFTGSTVLGIVGDESADIPGMELTRAQIGGRGSKINTEDKRSQRRGNRSMKKKYGKPSSYKKKGKKKK